MRIRNPLLWSECIGLRQCRIRRKLIARRYFAWFRSFDLFSQQTSASDGYTLIELLVVLTIISLLVALVGPRVLNYLGESKVKTARVQIEGFSSALDLFYMDAGRYPSATEGLNILVQRPASISAWNGPYLKGAHVPLDPWGNSYRYRERSDQSPPYEIISLGSDGAEGGSGTAADISSAQH